MLQQLRQEHYTFKLSLDYIASVWVTEGGFVFRMKKTNLKELGPSMPPIMGIVKTNAF